MKNINETSSRFEQMRSNSNGKKYSYCFFDYLYYRLYVTYKKHNDPPRFSACCVFAATFMIALFFLSIAANCIFTDFFFSRKNFIKGSSLIIQPIRRTNLYQRGNIVLHHPLLPAVHPEADCRHTAEIQRQQMEQDYPVLGNIYFPDMGDLGRG